MSEPTPLERAARALAPNRSDIAFDPMNDPFWADRVREVRAVLTAIREPSDQMVEAGDDDLRGSIDPAYEPSVYGRPAAGVWQSMIDAALEEG